MTRDQSPTSIDTAAARTLLEEVVRTPSVSGSEAACAQLLVEFFEEHGREVWLDDVGNVRAPGDDAVLLTSHIDTVPGDIPVRVEDGVLWGRGSVDAKGPLVSMAVAAVETGVSFAGVVGEEEDSRGARHLIEDRSRPRAIINGEPSGWADITLGYRGMLSGRYTAATPSGHSSRPDPNAIQHAIRWWHRVESTFEGDGEAVFEQVTPKPVGVAGGTSEDGLSLDAEMDVQFRIPPSQSVASVRESVEDQLQRGTVSWTNENDPVMASPRNDVATALRKGIREAGGEPSHLRKTGTSDMNTFAEAWDVPMATYGPGDSSLDHSPEEHIELEEFGRAVAVLETAARALQG